MPYDIKKSGNKWYIYHAGTNNKAVKKGYESKGAAQKVASLRIQYGDKRKKK